MMIASIAIMVIYGLGIIAVIIGLIYVIVNRVNEKKKERFEQRDN